MSSVSDYSLANQGFSAFRTELNNILGAINTHNLATSAPASLAAGSIWVDSSSAGTHTLKYYDGSDSIILCNVNTSANTVDFIDSTVVATTWESKSADFTAEAGKSYFCDTTSNAIDVTLPSGTIGDEIHFLDVSGTFDTNDLTILYGSSKIQGASANLDVSTERAGFTLVYYNATQGWLLKDK